MVALAVQQNGLALHYVSERFKDDPVCVTLAVQQNGLALEHASARFKNDPVLLTIAVQRDGTAIGYASDELKRNESIVKLAVQQQPFVVLMLLPDFKDNPDFLMDVIILNSGVYNFLPARLKTNIEFLVAAIDKNPHVYAELPPRLKLELTARMKRSLSDLTQLELANQVFHPTTENPIATLGHASRSFQTEVEQYLTPSAATRVVEDHIERAPSQFPTDTVRSVAHTIRNYGGKRTKQKKTNVITKRVRN
jgi:hypothetical protein